jgi:cysteine desulfurase
MTRNQLPSILPIYLDYAATTPVDPRVIDKMVSQLSQTSGRYGNASASHSYGTVASAVIEEARQSVASLVNAKSNCIIWTSGATESNNLSLKGVAEFYKRYGNHIITSQTEHRSILDTCAYLARQGFEITYLKPLSDGLIDIAQLEAAIRSDTILISIMHVNNETGVIQDIASIGQLARQKGIFFHVDAAQSVGKIPIDVQALPIDLMSFSAHKLYGPKGIGALYVSDLPRIRLTPQHHGGGQERGMRAGTLPTHQIAGMGEAFRIASDEGLIEAQRLQTLQNCLWLGIRDLPGVYLNGHASLRMPGIINIRFEGMEKERLMSCLLPLLAVSSASACAAATLETSYVLSAMGLRSELAHRSIRFSIGRYTTIEEIERTIELIHQYYKPQVNSLGFNTT